MILVCHATYVARPMRAIKPKPWGAALCPHNDQLGHLSMLLETYATRVLTGSRIDGSSFSGLLTRVDIGHIRMGSAGNGRITS